MPSASDTHVTGNFPALSCDVLFRLATNFASLVLSELLSCFAENFSDKVLEQLTLLKASASQIQDLRNKLSQ